MSGLVAGYGREGRKNSERGENGDTGEPHDRMRPGINHLAVTIGGRPALALTANGSFDAASTTLHATHIAVHFAGP